MLGFLFFVFALVLYLGILALILAPFFTIPLCSILTLAWKKASHEELRLTPWKNSERFWYFVLHCSWVSLIIPVGSLLFLVLFPMYFMIEEGYWEAWLAYYMYLDFIPCYLLNMISSILCVTPIKANSLILYFYAWLLHTLTGSIIILIGSGVVYATSKIRLPEMITMGLFFIVTLLFSVLLLVISVWILSRNYTKLDQPEEP